MSLLLIGIGIGLILPYLVGTIVTLVRERLRRRRETHRAQLKAWNDYVHGGEKPSSVRLNSDGSIDILTDKSKLITRQPITFKQDDEIVEIDESGRVFRAGEKKS